MTVREFEALVAQALDGLPETFAKLLDNVEVVVEIWPSRQDLIDGRVTRGTLFGLYRGIPQTKRTHYHSVLPDKISIFAGPIVMAYGDNPEVIKKQVRNTVLHEIGHHFGMSDEEIRRAGK
jgi:predicted Zn-dependent protease with MMP-like domain